MSVFNQIASGGGGEYKAEFISQNAYSAGTTIQFDVPDDCTTIEYFCAIAIPRSTTTAAQLATGTAGLKYNFGIIYDGTSWRISTFYYSGSKYYLRNYSGILTSLENGFLSVNYPSSSYPWNTFPAGTTIQYYAIIVYK